MPEPRIPLLNGDRERIVQVMPRAVMAEMEGRGRRWVHYAFIPQSSTTVV